MQRIVEIMRIVALLLTFLAWNYGVASCLDAYSKFYRHLSPIPFTGEMKLVKGEILRYGNISTNGIRDLDREFEDGVYLFLVIIPKPGSEFLVWSPEIPDESFAVTDQPFFVKHRTLFRRASEFLGIDENILKEKVFGSGSFIVTNGKIREVNNFCGTFRSGHEHLSYSLEVLRNHGLQIEETTSIIPYNAEALTLKHSQDIDRLELIKENLYIPERRAIREHLAKLYRESFKNYPSSELAGTLDIKTLSSDVYWLASIRTNFYSPTEVYHLLFLLDSCNSDGIEFSVVIAHRMPDIFQVFKLGEAIIDYHHVIERLATIRNTLEPLSRHQSDSKWLWLLTNISNYEYDSAETYNLLSSLRAVLESFDNKGPKDAFSTLISLLSIKNGQSVYFPRSLNELIDELESLSQMLANKKK